MDIIQILELAVAAFFFVSGVITLFSGKIFGEKKEYQKYTEESVKKYSRIYGPGEALVGLLIAAGVLFGTVFAEDKTSAVSKLIIYGGFGLAIVILIVVSLVKNRFLVEKETEDNGEFIGLDAEVANEEPANEEPANEDPANEGPVNEEPAKEEPAKEEPANEESTNEESANEEPAKKEENHE